MTANYKRLDETRPPYCWWIRQGCFRWCAISIPIGLNNVLALGDLAKYFNLPTILTTS